MPEEVRELLGLVVKLLEIAGAGALILGFLIATLLFLRRYFREGADAGDSSLSAVPRASC